MLAPARQDRADRPGRQAAAATGRARASTPGTAGPPRPPRWPPSPSPRSGREPPELGGGRRLAAGPPPGHRLAAATRPRGRPSPPWRSSTARPRRPRTATAWSSPSTTARSTRPTSSAPTEGKAVRVPATVRQGRRQNRVKFDIEGRGTFGYAVTLTGFTRDFGPDQDRANKPFVLHRRVYWRRHPELDGKPLPTGLRRRRSTPQTFENTRHARSPLGGKVPIARRGLSRPARAASPSWERDFLVVEEYLPAGTTLVEGSVQSQAGALHGRGRRPDLLLRARPVPGAISYDVYGYLPGQYRALPAERLAAPTSRAAATWASRASFKVLAPGEKSTDPYKPTPDELYARGKALFDAGRLAEAAAPLEGALGRLHPPRRRRQGRRADAPDDPHQGLQPRKVVVSTSRSSRRRPPSWSSRSTTSRSSAGPTATSASTSGPTSSGGRRPRRATWKTPGSARSSASAARRSTAIAYLLDLWREYPDTASIESDFFGLAQVLAGLAGKATTDPALRARAGRGRGHAVRAAPAGDPPDPGLPRPVARRTRWPTRRAWPWSGRSSSWRTSRRS